MDKEKLNDIVCESSSDYAVLNNAYNYIENLEQKVQKQKEVIDKAIEFIKSSQCKYDGWEIANQLYENEIKQLLDILKEVSE